MSAWHVAAVIIALALLLYLLLALLKPEKML